MDNFSQMAAPAPPPNGLLARRGLGGSRDVVTAASLRPRTVAICDRQPLTSIGIRSVVAEVATLRFLLAVDSLEAARVVVRMHAPDVMVIDETFGDKAILEWLRRTRPAHSRSKVVIWGVSFVRNQALSLVRAGARGILRKTAPTPVVLDCIETVASGRAWFDGSAGPGACACEPADFGLTARERQVAKLVEQGLDNRQIGRRLGISSGTVKVHLKHVIQKTAGPDRFGLSLSALQRQVSNAGLAMENAGFRDVSGSEVFIGARDRGPTYRARAASLAGRFSNSLGMRPLERAG
jgi:DNA-binding NarL/FixJ family response regulator